MSLRPLALITGGCRRLGAHIAMRLAAAGYDLALHAGHDPELEPWLADALRAVEFAVFVADLGEATEVARLPEKVADRFGRPIALLVNSASRFAVAEPGGGPHDAVMAHMAVNLAAPFALAIAVAEAASGEGAAIVNLLDQRIANPPPDQLAYTLSKQALAEATRTMAIALAPHVRVNGVAPGLVLPTADYAPGQVERLAQRMPLARHAAPQDVADAVAWLAQARSVTGQTLFVDGGAHLISFPRDFAYLDR